MKARTALAAAMTCLLVFAAGCATTAASTPAPTGASSGAVTVPPPCPAVGGDSKSGGLPNLRLSCLDSGGNIDVRRIRGPAVVNLWASWCGPCQQELPLLQKAARQGGDVQIVGVDTNDSVGSALAFVRRTGATYPQLNDPKGKLAIALGAPGLPVTVAIDAAGDIVWRKVGIMAASDLAAGIQAATAHDAGAGDGGEE